MSQLKQLIQDNDHREEAFKKESIAEVNKLRRQLSSLTSSHDDLTSQNQMISSERERISLQLDHLQSKFNEVESSNALLSRELEGKVKIEQNCKDKISSLESSITALRAEIAASDENAQKEMRAFQHNNDRQVNSLANDKQSLMSALAALQAENQSILDKCHDLEDSLARVSSRLKYSKKRPSSQRLHS